MLKDAMQAVAEAGHRSDAQAQAAAMGKANMIDVVTAVAESEAPCVRRSPGAPHFNRPAPWGR
jgi:hypothetical protein